MRQYLLIAVDYDDPADPPAEWPWAEGVSIPRGRARVVQVVDVTGEPPRVEVARGKR